MPNRPAGWRDLEDLAARIQRQLAPGAEVEQGEHIVGRSGVVRKLDLSIRQQVGAHPILIVFDCKRHGRAVPVKHVEAFAAQRDDVGANMGVMISNTGFTRGARAVAQQLRISLQTLRDAQDADWQALVGDKAWVTLVGAEIHDVTAQVVTENGRRISVPFEFRLLDREGQPGDVVRDLFWKGWNQTPLPRPLGPVTMEIIPEPAAAYVQQDHGRMSIESVLVQGRCVARQWVVNLTLSSGHVLQDVHSAGPVYGELASAGFDWADIMTSSPGVEMTEGQYSDVIQRSQIIVDLSKVKRFLRVMVTSDQTKTRRRTS